MFGDVMGVVWECSGGCLAMFCKLVEEALGGCWGCSKECLEMLWGLSKGALVFVWACSGMFRVLWG